MVKKTMSPEAKRAFNEIDGFALPDGKGLVCYTHEDKYTVNICLEDGSDDDSPDVAEICSSGRVNIFYDGLLHRTVAPESVRTICVSKNIEYTEKPHDEKSLQNFRESIAGLSQILARLEAQQR